LWGLVEYRIRQVTIKYSKEKARKRRAQLSEAEHKLRQCEDKCNLSPTAENISQLENAKNEYETLFDYIIQGKILRSKWNWYENGEKNSKFFLNLENNSSRKTCIRRLLDNQSKVVLDSQRILKELENNYKSLYTKQVSTASEEIFSSFLDNTDCIPVLTEDQKALCEGSLSKDECYNALNDLPNGKSPGNDGLTQNFIRNFGLSLANF